MSGQSITDRVMAAKHSIAGQGLAKGVHKSTTEEIMGPKRKHLDYLIACTREPNVNISQLATLLMERTQNSSWVVVFKSLITMHHLMNHGNEKFTHYLSSNNYNLNLSNFLDKTAVHGFDMSTYIRRYSKYLNEKALSYRTMAFDFCKVKRGKDDGLLRTLNEEKLLKTLPVLQVQVDSLLEFEITSNELNNGVINACFMLLFKDLIRLFACYNEGIINLLERYFDMSKKMCKQSFTIYKNFLERMDKVSSFLKVAENVGIDKGEIPDLAKAPASLLEALEDHLKSLEGSKKSANLPKPASVTSAIDSLTAVSHQLTEDDKRLILEEEKSRLEEMKKSKAEDAIAHTAEKKAEKLTSQPSIDLFSANADIKTNETKLSDDLFNLNDNGLSSLMSITSQNNSSANVVTANNPFMVTSDNNQAMNPINSNVMLQNQMPASNPTNNPFADAWNAPEVKPTESSFASFTDSTSSNAFDGMGDIMKPLNTNTTNPINANISGTSSNKIQGNDLDASLASLIGNLNMATPIMNVQKQGGHQWNNSTNIGDKKLTGGQQWSSPQNTVMSAPTPVSNQFQTMPMYNNPSYNTMYNPISQQQIYGIQPTQQNIQNQQNPMMPQGNSNNFNKAIVNDPFGAL